MRSTSSFSLLGRTCSPAGGFTSAEAGNKEAWGRTHLSWQASCCCCCCCRGPAPGHKGPEGEAPRRSMVRGLEGMARLREGLRRFKAAARPPSLAPRGSKAAARPSSCSGCCINRQLLPSAASTNTRPMPGSCAPNAASPLSHPTGATRQYRLYRRSMPSGCNWMAVSSSTLASASMRRCCASLSSSESSLATSDTRRAATAASSIAFCAAAEAAPASWGSKLRGMAAGGG
mmetsp:Transcript_16879/g.46597  ORF Transcript_16879/g.46597 Transcript_16879/m.46597 type:complete len:231 (+) Transcript_16879:1694-2386(+)